MKATICVIAAVTALTVAGSALAGVARFYSANPNLALQRFEQKANRQAGFTGTSCWLYGGNSKTGWLHVGCVGNFNYAGTTYRFKLVATPVSCSQVAETLTVPGLIDGKKSTAAWHHTTFACRAS